jgi:hypothetical protein
MPAIALHTRLVVAGIPLGLRLATVAQHADHKQAAARVQSLVQCGGINVHALHWRAMEHFTSITGRNICHDQESTLGPRCSGVRRLAFPKSSSDRVSTADRGAGVAMARLGRGGGGGGRRGFGGAFVLLGEVLDCTKSVDCGNTMPGPSGSRSIDAD